MCLDAYKKLAGQINDMKKDCNINHVAFQMEKEDKTLMMRKITLTVATHLSNISIKNK